MEELWKSHQVVIQYPCWWEYKVIGPDEERLRDAARGIVGEREHVLSFSHRSRTGKYCSLRVDVVVPDEQTRNDLFHALKRHRDIIMVL